MSCVSAAGLPCGPAYRARAILDLLPENVTVLRGALGLVEWLFKVLEGSRIWTTGPPGQVRPFSGAHDGICVDSLYPRGDNAITIEIRKTEVFAKWINGLQDLRTRARIPVRIERLNL